MPDTRPAYQRDGRVHMRERTTGTCTTCGAQLGEKHIPQNGVK